MSRFDRPLRKGLNWSPGAPELAILVAVLSVSACRRAEPGAGPDGARPMIAVRRALTTGPHVLSGTVFGSGIAMPGTLVEALTDGTTSVVASSTTDASGDFSLSLNDATYDLRLTPPAGSGFGVQAVQNLVMAGTDRRDDIVLIAKGGVVAGHVLGYLGVGIPGADVGVHDNATGATVTSGTTDAQGAYQLNLGPGTYYFIVTPHYPYPAGAPNQGWAEYLYNQTISGSTTLDFNLPVVKVQGTVTDSSGAPVPGVPVAAVGSNYDVSRQTYFNGGVQTDDSGHYEVLVFAGSADTFTFTPSLPLGTLVQSGVTVNSDVTRDIVLSAATVVGGYVLGYLGVGIPGANVGVHDNATGATVTSGTTDAQGAYQLNLGPGTYYFIVTPPNPYPAGAPNQGWAEYLYNQTISGSTTLDFNLPVVKVQGTVTDSNGAPVPGVPVAAVGSNYVVSTQTYFNAGVQTDADGHYELLVFAGSADTFTVTPPPASGFSITVLSNVSVASDFAQTIILESPDLSPPVIVAGPTVVHLSDTSVSINWKTNEPATSVADYGVGGLTVSTSSTTLVTTHEVTLIGLLPSTVYQYRVGSTDGSGNGPTQSVTLTFQTEDPPGDITPPVITSSPTATSIGQTTAIVVWGTDEPASTVVHYGTSASLVTDVGIAGQFTRDHQVTLSGLLPSTQYSFDVESTDPDGNGPTLSAVVSFTTAAVPDTTPPQIVTGPEVPSATDTTLTVVWTTDEAASSGVSGNDGTTFFVAADDKLVRQHQVVLVGLSPGTTYKITVSSTDLAGNGPTLGGPISAATTTTTNSSPVVTVPANLVVEATNAAGAAVTFSATATDAEDGTLTTVCTPASGAQFALGGTTVVCQATDSRGATASATFSITVRDTTPPSLTVPPAITVDANSGGAAVVTFATTATDTVSAAVTPACVPASGSSFPVGTTTVTCTAKDATGNQSTGTFAVTVRKPNTPPVVSVPGHLVGEAVGPGGRMVSFVVSAFDAEDGPLTPSCTSASGSVFPVGATVVRCTATDSSGASSTASFVVTVVDTTPPVLTLPASITVNLDLGGTAVVTFDATAADLVSGSVTPNCVPASGTRFAVGTTVVSCTAQDAAANRSNGSFTVTVRGVNSPPLVTVPANLAVEATGPGGAKVVFQATASDPEDGPLPPDCSPASGTTFRLGTTTVSCHATDSAGATASASFVVTVRDTSPPVFVGTASNTTAFASCTGGAPVAYVAPTATDATSGSVSVKCTPAKDLTFPVGSTTVSCSAKDAAGNVATTTFTVRVIYQAATDGTFFSSPLKADGSAKFKRGTMVPVKFELTGTSSGIANLHARLLIAAVHGGVPGTYQAAPGSGTPGGGPSFDYDRSRKVYGFDLDTKNLATGTWSLKADLGDGVQHTVNLETTP